MVKGGCSESILRGYGGLLLNGDFEGIIRNKYFTAAFISIDRSVCQG